MDVGVGKENICGPVATAGVVVPPLCPVATGVPLRVACLEVGVGSEGICPADPDPEPCPTGPALRPPEGYLILLGGLSKRSCSPRVNDGGRAFPLWPGPGGPGWPDWSWVRSAPVYDSA